MVEDIYFVLNYPIDQKIQKNDIIDDLYPKSFPKIFDILCICCVMYKSLYIFKYLAANGKMAETIVKLVKDYQK